MTENQLGVVGERIFDRMERDDGYFLTYPTDEIQVVGHKTYLLIRAIGIEIEKIEKKISNIERVLEDVASRDVGNVQLKEFS
jgi:hypothetical protein